MKGWNKQKRNDKTKIPFIFNTIGARMTLKYKKK